MILVALRPSGGQNNNLLGGNSAIFTKHVRETMRTSGFEDKASSTGLFIFRFERLISALISIHEALETFRAEYLKQSEEQTLPIKFIFHYIENKGELMPTFCDQGSTAWDHIKKEQLYVSRTLKLQWPELVADNIDLRCTFHLEEEGLYRTDFLQQPEFNSVRLFQYRHLPLRGRQQECFYCGMQNHGPGSCPSKFLDIDIMAIKDLGYLSFPEINKVFREVFLNTEGVRNKLAAGVKQGQLRKDHELLVYISYLDINRIFQTRFLQKITFSKYAKWDAFYASDKVVQDDANLHIGLDCLRVGKYDQAEKKFLAGTGHQEEKLFYAYVGLAFVALERGRMRDMGHFLDTAYSNATNEKEKIYINLLLCRYFRLFGDMWKAQQTVKTLQSLKHNLFVARYFNALIEVSGGFSEQAMTELRSMLSGPQEYFMVLMLDPQLLPFHGFIDEILQTKLEMLGKEANQQLAEARAEAEELSIWLGLEDKRYLEVA